MKVALVCVLTALAVSTSTIRSEGALQPPYEPVHYAARALILSHYSLQVTPELLYGEPALTPVSKRSCHTPLEFLDATMQWLSFTLVEWLVSWNVRTIHQPQFDEIDPPAVSRLCIKAD